ncbi:transposase [Parathermosynechococcus lividus]
MFLIDSTVITPTSKLLWLQGYHHVKLINGLNVEQGNLSDCLIHFGQGHDAKFADSVQMMIPENGIYIMDRGFASWQCLDQMSLTGTKCLVRIKNNIKNNMKTEFKHDQYRVVWFCDVESS